MSRVIFASHGGLSKGMKDSVSMIVGDLAKDVKSDDSFPKEAKDWKTIEEYLESKRASFAAIDTAKEAYEKYKE